MNRITLETLVSNGIIQLTAGACFGLFLLFWLDVRQRSWLLKSLLACLTMGLAVYCLLHATTALHRSCWSICWLLSVASLLIAIRKWIRGTPSDDYREQVWLSGSSNTGKEAHDGVQRAPDKWFSLMPLAASAVVIAMNVVESAPVLVVTNWVVLAGIQTACVALMIGLGVMNSLTMTFVDTSATLVSKSPFSSVAWKYVNRLSLLISAILLTVCLIQFLQPFPTDPAIRPPVSVQLVARMFGLMIVVASFVVWMVPRRLSLCQQSGKQPKDWLTLTIAAWLGLLAFAVVGVLPTTWPWIYFR